MAKPESTATVELMAKCRELIGPSADLMLDCWMTFDLDFAVRICEALKPYRMRWMEEMLMPYDWEGHRALRQRVPWQTLADGEHWSTRHPGNEGRAGAARRFDPSRYLLDRGLHRGDETAHYADSQGVQMCLHTGGNDPYGQHWTAAMPNTPLIEFFRWISARGAVSGVLSRDAFKVGAATLQSSAGGPTCHETVGSVCPKAPALGSTSQGLAKGGVIVKITQIEEFVTAVPHIPSIEKSRPGEYLNGPSA